MRRHARVDSSVGESRTVRLVDLLLGVPELIVMI